MCNDVFSQFAFFQGFSPAQMDLLRPLFTVCDFSSNVVIFEQGEPAEYLYIVVSGEVVVNYKPDDGPPLTVARVQSGGIVGWSAALGSHQYTSGAETLAESQLLRVRGADLRCLCDCYPETGNVILERLAAAIAERLRNTHPQVVAMLQNGLRSLQP